MMGPTDGKKINCWEYFDCGRQPGGEKVIELGVCPASTAEEFDLINGGTNAGRYCWKVAGTLGSGETTCSYADKLTNCINCEFFKMVQDKQSVIFVH